MIHYHAGNAELCALLVLPSLVPDARCKVDVDKIIYIAKVFVTFIPALYVLLGIKRCDFHGSIKPVRVDWALNRSGKKL